VNGGDPTRAGYAMSAGALLRDAREAAGLSMDDVALQLKLAPRQVRAIEEDDYARLPGRTFVRGFVRNYARLVNLDPDAILATLPRGESTSPLERLTYTPGSPPVVEMPVAGERNRKSATRWLIPLLLLTIVAAAAYYEYSRTSSGPRRAATDVAPAPASAPAGSQTSTSLPNPLESARSEASSPAAAPPEKAAEPATTPTSPASAADSIVLTWTGPSWVEVRDANGTPLLMQTGTAGSTQALSGAAPFEIVIGNASNVAIAFRGQSVDLAPHTRYNVARFTLK
jgi:cytoskeleton protein RodZ